MDFHHSFQQPIDLKNFKIFGLPALPADVILSYMAPVDLFMFSMYSEDARKLLNRLKFHMTLMLDNSVIAFNLENESKNSLLIFVDENPRPNGPTFHIPALPRYVKCQLYQPKVLCTYWRRNEKEKGLKLLMDYFTSVFKNISIGVDYGGWFRAAYRNRIYPPNENSRKRLREVRRMKAIVKKMKLKTRLYMDGNNKIHKFKQLNELISCRALDVSECRLTKMEIKKLYKKWMECKNPGWVRLGNLRKFKLEDLESGNLIVNENMDNLKKQHFEVTRSDGIKAKIQLVNDTRHAISNISFDIIKLQ